MKMSSHEDDVYSTPKTAQQNVMVSPEQDNPINYGDVKKEDDTFVREEANVNSPCSSKESSVIGRDTNISNIGIRDTPLMVRGSPMSFDDFSPALIGALLLLKHKAN